MPTYSKNHKRYYEKNKERIKAKSIAWSVENRQKRWKIARKGQWNRRERMRKKASKIYNNQCQSCLNNDFRILEFHHIDTRLKGITGQVLFKLIVDTNKKLPGIILLCANCHKIIHFLKRQYRVFSST